MRLVVLFLHRRKPRPRPAAMSDAEDEVEEDPRIAQLYNFASKRYDDDGKYTGEPQELVDYVAKLGTDKAIVHGSMMLNPAVARAYFIVMALIDADGEDEPTVAECVTLRRTALKACVADGGAHALLAALESYGVLRGKEDSFFGDKTCRVSNLPRFVARPAAASDRASCLGHLSSSLAMQTGSQYFRRSAVWRLRCVPGAPYLTLHIVYLPPHLTTSHVLCCTLANSASVTPGSKLHCHVRCSTSSTMVVTGSRAPMVGGTTPT